MTTHRTLTAFLLAATLLAGCADNAGETRDDTPAAPADSLQGQLGGAITAPADGNGTVGLDTPLFLTAQAGPDGPLTPFRWRIPEGAIVRYQPFPENSDFIIEQLIFEMVPVFGEGEESPAEYAILVFRLSEEASLGSSILGIPFASETNTLLDTTNAQSEPKLASRYLFVTAGSLEEGDELGFVVAARADSPRDFGLLLSPRDSRPQNGEAAPESTEDLLGNRTALVLEPAGSGTGFAFSAYQSFRIFSPPGTPFYREARAGSVAVADGLPRGSDPVLTARLATISSSFSDAGFSRASASMFMFGQAATCAAGTYDIDVDLHGTQVKNRNLVIDDFTPLGVGTLLTGMPMFFAIGQGSGSSEASLKLDYASACTYESISFSKLDLGATTEDFFGVSAAVGGSTYAGLAGSIPPSTMQRRGNDVILEENGSTIEYVGAGPLFAPWLDAVAEAW